jgi:hypothetical protein
MVSKRTSRAGSSFRQRAVPEQNEALSRNQDPKTSQVLTASSSNKFSDLFDTSSAFFQEEDSATQVDSPSARSDGSKLVRLLEAKRAATSEAVLSPHSVTRGDHELSLNAPSFTPLAHIRSNPTTPPPPVSQVISVSPRDSLNLQWIYLDPNSARQGPFTTNQMSSWFEAGYFPKNLPVFWYRTGEVISPNPVFHPLDMCYPRNSPPFSTYPIVAPTSNPEPASGQSARKPAAKIESASIGTESHGKGWLWSPAEDAKLTTAKSQNSMSLSEIMKAEEARKKSSTKGGKK